MQTAPAPPPDAAPRKPGTRVFLFAAVGVVVLLLLVLLFGPLVIGAVAKARIRSLVAESLDAEVSLRDVSVSWSGHATLEDLRVVPRGFSSPLLEVPRIDVDFSPTAALRGKVLAEIRVTAPKFLIEKGPDGRFNYERPVRPPASADEADAPSSSSSSPHILARLHAVDGLVVIRNGGSETRYSNLRLDAWTGWPSLRVSISDQVAGEGSLHIEGTYDLRGKSGEIGGTLTRLSLANLTPAARAYSPLVSLEGAAEGFFAYRFQGLRRVGGSAELRLDGFSAALGDRTFKLDALRLTHEGGVDEKGAGRHRVSLRNGDALQADLTVDVADAFGTPAARTTLTARSNLAGLTGLLAGLGFLPQGTALSGSFEVTGSVASKGPPVGGPARVAAEVDLTATGRGVAVTVDGRKTALDAFTLRHRGTLDEKGVGANTLDLSLGPALVAEGRFDVTDAYGRAPAARATLAARSDLAAMGRLLEKALGFKPGMSLEGSAGMTGAASLGGAGPVQGSLDLSLRDLVAVEPGPKRHPIDPSITLKAAGSWDGATKTAAATELSLRSTFASLDGKGGAVLGGASPELRATSLKVDVDLGLLGAKLASFLEQPPGLAGRAVASASAEGEVVSLDVALHGLRAGDYGPIDAALVQKGRFSPAGDGAFAIETCTLTSKAATATVAGAIAKVMSSDRAGTLRLEGEIDPVELSKLKPGLRLGGPRIPLRGSVQMKEGATIAAVSARLDGLQLLSEKPADGARLLTSEALRFTSVRRQGEHSIAAASDRCTLVGPAGTVATGLETRLTVKGDAVTGSTSFKDLEASKPGGPPSKMGIATIDHHLSLAGNDVVLTRVRMTSDFLKGDLTGMIRNAASAPEFVKVAGRFTYVPDRLGAVLAPFVDGTLQGVEERSLTVDLNGKAADLALWEVLRGAAGDAVLDLATFTLNGVSVSGKADLRLRDGRLSTGSPLAVNRGTSSIDALLDFNLPARKPASRLTFVAKDVDANADMAPMLESINPIFRTVSGTVAGKISSDFALDWVGPIDPSTADWAAASKAHLVGGGTFGVRDLSITGSPAVALILEALGEGNVLKGDLQATQVQIRDGRCLYSGMVLKLSRYSVVFSGWVEFSTPKKEMNLRVEMPLTESMMKRWPNLQKYTGKSLMVPLTGTVDSPRFDWKTAIGEYAAKAVEGVLLEKLEDLLKRREKKKDEKK